MHDPDDLATLWSFVVGTTCVLRADGDCWTVRIDQDGVTVRERTLQDGKTAVAVAAEWEVEFERFATSRIEPPPGH